MEQLELTQATINLSVLKSLKVIYVSIVRMLKL